MFRPLALCVFATGMVASLAVAALCVPMAYTGEWGPFSGATGTAVLAAICLVLNLDKTRQDRPAVAQASPQPQTA